MSVSKCAVGGRPRDTYVKSCPARRSMSEPTHFFWRNASLLAWWVCYALDVCSLGHFQFVLIAKVAVTYPLKLLRYHWWRGRVPLQPDVFPPKKLL